MSAMVRVLEAPARARGQRIRGKWGLGGRVGASHNPDLGRPREDEAKLPSVLAPPARARAPNQRARGARIRATSTVRSVTHHTGPVSDCAEARPLVARAARAKVVAKRNFMAEWYRHGCASRKKVGRRKERERDGVVVVVEQEGLELCWGRAMARGAG